jgi:aldose 1-epimerase
MSGDGGVEGELRLGRAGGLELRLRSLGASWVSCSVPLRNGSRREVLLGFDSAQDQRANTAYVGATVGRWANRIAGPKLHRDGRSWLLQTEPGLGHQLHGGPGGFHQRDWSVQDHSAEHASFVLHSADGDQGFPGALDVTVRYALGPGLSVVVDFDAVLSGAQACPVSLTNHAYFQLDGTPVDVRGQRLRVAASHVLPVDAKGLPRGGPMAVDGTPFDLLQARRIDAALDHAFLLQGDASLQATDSRVVLHLSTTMPALQVYTGEFLPEGTGGRWPRFGGIALEPGWLPDSPAHPAWPQPDCWLAPGQRWQHRIVYRFEV